MPKIINVAIITLLLSGCATTHKVAHILKPWHPCEPEQEVFQRFACEHYGEDFCKGRAVIVDQTHDNDGYYIASYQGAKAKWIRIDWPRVSRRLCGGFGNEK